jgi:hypothetical protein
MKKGTAHWIVGSFTIMILFISFLFVRDFGYLNEWSRPIDSGKFSDWGSTISGLMATGAFIFAFITFFNQIKSTSKQDVENKFFILIENLQFILNQIKLRVRLDDEIKISNLDNEVKWKAKYNRIQDIEGREALRTILIKLNKDLKTIDLDKMFDGLSEEEVEERNYQKIYDKYFHILGHYFRYVYNIMKYVDSSETNSDIEKKRLIDLLQAQLSSDEMGLIFYNAIFNDKAKKKVTGERKFFELLEKYKLLENIDDKSLADNLHKKSIILIRLNRSMPLALSNHN